MNKFKQGILAIVISMNVAVAQAQVGGGLSKAKTVGDDIQTGLFALAGVMAVIYLIYLAVMAFTEKKSWADFGWGIVHVGVAGASVSIATWAWSAFA